MVAGLQKGRNNDFYTRQMNYNIPDVVIQQLYTMGERDRGREGGGERY